MGLTLSAAARQPLDQFMTTHKPDTLYCSKYLDVKGLVSVGSFGSLLIDPELISLPTAKALAYRGTNTGVRRPQSI